MQKVNYVLSSYKDTKTYETLFKNYLRRYFFDLFSSTWASEDLTQQEHDYIMGKLYYLGHVCAFKFDGIDDVGFGDFSVFDWNLYNYPINAQPVVNRYTRGVPLRPLPVDSENGIVLMYLMKDRRPLQPIINVLIDKVVDIEMTLRTQLYAHKIPLILANSAVNTEGLEQFLKNIQDNVPALLVNDRPDMSVPGGVEFVLDKLYTYEQHIIDEIFTLFGITTMNVEKRERLTAQESSVGELKANINRKNIQLQLDDFSKKVEKYLGRKITFKNTIEEIKEEQMKQQLLLANQFSMNNQNNEQEKGDNKNEIQK